MTIRSHLLLLVAGAFVPLMLFAVSITSFSWWQQRNSLELRYLERARAMTIALDTELDGSIRVLRSLAFSPDLDDEHMAQFLGRMRRFLAAQPLWSTFAVGDARWRTVAAVGRNPLSAQLPAIANGLLERVSRTHQPAVSGLVHAPDGHYETQIAMPVERGGELRYVMLVSVEQPRWVKFMGQYPVGSGATSTLLDQDGIVIARTADNDRWVGKPAPASMLARTRSAAEGAYRNTGLDGQSYYSAHDRSLHWGWTIATGIPAATVEAALLDSSALLAAAAFLSIGLAVLLAFVFGRRIQRPIKALGESARALAVGGEVPTHGRSRIAEVDEVERAFSEAGTTLRERSNALNEALQREQQARREAEEASRAKDHFLAMLGHELRNPLNAIAGAVGVLHQVEPHGPQAMRSREIIDRQAMSLRELVDDLLDVARVTSGKIILHERPVDLAQVVRRTLAMMTAAGRLSRHHVDSDCREAWVRGDDTRLEQVANNLLDNAVKYTPPGAPSSCAPGRAAKMRCSRYGTPGWASRRNCSPTSSTSSPRASALSTARKAAWAWGSPSCAGWWSCRAGACSRRARERGGVLRSWCACPWWRRRSPGRRRPGIRNTRR